MTEQLTREEAERRWGPDPTQWPAWTCATCQQRHSGWATDCPRCGAVRMKPEPWGPIPEPWGHKVTIHVYVEGDISRAADVSDFYASLSPEPEPDFVGIGISEVAERPVDQGTS